MSQIEWNKNLELQLDHDHLSLKSPLGFVGLITDMIEMTVDPHPSHQKEDLYSRYRGGQFK